MPHVPVRVHAPHAWLLANECLWDTVVNMRTRTYLIFWSALFIGVVLAVVLAGCSVPNDQQAVVKGIETVLTARVEPISTTQPTAIPPTAITRSAIPLTAVKPTAIPPSPDPYSSGGRIAFTSRRDGNGEIYVMDADGSNQTNLTSNPAHEYFPDW